MVIYLVFNGFYSCFWIWGQFWASRLLLVFLLKSMVSIRQLLAQKLFGVHSVPSKTQAEIQRVYTGLGAEFGQPIMDANITFAVKREPVAHRIVFAVAHDVFDNWFEVEPLEEGVDKEKFNEAVQKVLLLLNAKDVFTQDAVFERAYGWSIVVIGYQDKAPTLKTPVESLPKME